MDMYSDPEWRANHNDIATLHDQICPSHIPSDWRILYAQDSSNTWYCITRGIFGNPDGFYVSRGPDKSILMNLLESANNDWFVDWQLSSLVRKAKEQYNVDLTSLNFSGK